MHALLRLGNAWLVFCSLTERTDKVGYAYVAYKMLTVKMWPTDR